VEELRALDEVSQAVNSTLDLQTALDTIVARAAQISGTAHPRQELGVPRGRSGGIAAALNKRGITTARGKETRERTAHCSERARHDGSSLALT
jgi:GAF domain-containing protein